MTCHAQVNIINYATQLCGILNDSASGGFKRFQVYMRILPGPAAKPATGAHTPRLPSAAALARARSRRRHPLPISAPQRPAAAHAPARPPTRPPAPAARRRSGLPGAARAPGRGDLRTATAAVSVPATARRWRFQHRTAASEAAGAGSRRQLVDEKIDACRNARTGLAQGRRRREQARGGLGARASAPYRCRRHHWSKGK